MPTPEEIAAAEAEKNKNAPPATFDTIIPEEFRDRTYLSDLKALPVGPDSYKALFKKLDGAQTLIGKKTGIPDANATPEEVEKFYSSLRPAKFEDYEFPAAKEGQTAPDPESLKAIKGIFHEAGLSKSQAAKLSAKFEEFAAKQNAPAIEAAKKQDAEFVEMTNKAFGAENAKVLERSRTLLATLTPDTLKPYLVKLPNESLVVLSAVMEAVRAKFMKEDNLDGAGNGGAPTDENTLREEAKTLQMSPAWKDFTHKDHVATQKRVNDIYAAIGKARKK